MRINHQRDNKEHCYWQDSRLERRASLHSPLLAAQPSWNSSAETISDVESHHPHRPQRH